MNKDDLFERKRKANTLRKAEDYENALKEYRELWAETGDQYDGAGLLHCLRKLDLDDEANEFASELYTRYSGFKWCIIEITWTLISCRLLKYDIKNDLDKIIQTAEFILKLKPDTVALNVTVLRVLKSAKVSNNWNAVNEWIMKIDPLTLSDEPKKDREGKGDWSEKSLWYNYRINGLFKIKEYEEVIKITDEIADKFPKQKKFYMRLKALAYHALHNIPESQKLYEQLCRAKRTDWWLLHEYAKVIRDGGKNKDALRYMCLAANSNSKVELMVTLFEDIGSLFKVLGQIEPARAHFLLSKYTRINQGWPIHSFLEEEVDILNKQIGDRGPESFKEAFGICKKEWVKFMPQNVDTTRKNLMGRIKSIKIDRPFCFIQTKEELIFCFKTDVPSNVKENDEVIFDAVPSYDKKKNQNSWKASNVRLKVS